VVAARLVDDRERILGQIHDGSKTIKLLKFAVGNTPTIIAVYAVVMVEMPGFALEVLGGSRLVDTLDIPVFVSV